MLNKFDNCERMLSKQKFESEYLRELFKQKKPLWFKK